MITLLRKVALRFARYLFRFGYHQDSSSPSPNHLDGRGGEQEGGGLNLSEAIVVTTHAKRFSSSSLELIRRLSEIGGRPIFVVVNGDFPEGGFNPSLRTNFLVELSKLDAVFPICLGDGRGMSYMWNLGIRLSGGDRILILSDDLDIDENTLGRFVNQCFERLENADLVVANRSFGHFALTWDLIERVGWFDEILLGFGEEDGDFLWRCSSRNDVEIDWFDGAGLRNTSAHSGYEKVVKGVGKYSLFNRVVMFQHLYVEDSLGIQSTFSVPRSRRRTVPDYHKGEVAFRTLRHLLESRDETEISDDVGQFLESF